MDVNRRNLMKGVLTGSTLLSLGIPPAAVAGAAPGTGTSGRVRLLLGSNISDAEFAAGARTAFAANARHTPAYPGVAAVNNAKTGYGALEVVKLKSAHAPGGILATRLTGVLEQTALPPASWAGAVMGRLPTQSRNQTQPTCIAREFRQRRGVNCSAGMELSPGRLFIRNPRLNPPVREKTETKKEASPKACIHKPGPGWKRLDMR